MTQRDIKVCLAIAHCEGFEDEAKRADTYASSLERKLKRAIGFIKIVGEHKHLGVNEQVNKLLKELEE